MLKAVLHILSKPRYSTITLVLVYCMLNGRLALLNKHGRNASVFARNVGKFKEKCCVD